MTYIDTNAKNYGDALFMLAKELDEIDSVKNDFDVLIKALEQNTDYLKLLDTPAVSKEERVALADEAFGSLDPYVVNLVKILTEKHSVHLFPKIAEEFSALYDESRGIERAEAISAVKLSDEQEKRLTERLEAMTGKRVVLRNTVDPSILGGLKLRFSGRQLDGSVKARLESFEKSLKSTVV